MTDLTIAARSMGKNPGFHLVAILTLALGIGANTAIFSVIKGVLLNPLPYPGADRLVAIAQKDPKTPNPVTVDFTTTHDLRERSHSFEAMSLYRGASGALVEQGQPELINGMRVNYDFFDTLGFQVDLGRTFLPEEDRSTRRFEVILSHGLWVRRFGADPNVIGRVIHLSEAPFTVVGVLPAGFPRLIGSNQAEMFLPLGYDLGGPNACRGCQHLRLIGRLKAGVSAAQANAELNTIASGIVRENPTSYPANTGVVVTPLSDQLLGKVRTPLWILLAAVGFVLLIACVNVANLLLARSSGRGREIALRAALGAGRARLVRQLLTESALLAVVGGAAGIALGWLATAAFTRFAPGNIPRLGEIRMDATVLLFSLGTSLFTGILFGLAPALRASRVDLNDALKRLGKATGGRSHRGLRDALAAAEFALAFVLVAGAGLLGKSFVHLMSVDPGYDPHHVLTLGAYVYGSRYQSRPEVEIALYDQVMTALRARPDVESAAMVSTLPLNGFDRRALHIQDRPLANEADAPSADNYSITPEYFRVLRIPLKRGRAFTDQDRAGAPLVAVVSEFLARSIWPGEDAIGKHIQVGGRDDKKPFATIVGVVGDVRQYGLDRAPQMGVYTPLAQDTNFSYQMVIRTTIEPERLAQAARDAFAQADKTQPVFAVEPMDAYLSSSLAERSFTLTLLGVFAALALGLAAIGVYGVVSYAVSLRTREIGIRMAIGARWTDVLGMILREGLSVAAAGLAVGFAASLALTRFLAGLLYEVRPADLATSVSAAALLAAVALIAIYVPARRASRVDPMIALRYE